MARLRTDAGDLLIVVNMENGAGLAYPDDIQDAWHPTQGGYDKMAELWYQKLVCILPQP